MARFLEHLQQKKYSRNSLDSHRLDLMRFYEWLTEGEPSGHETARLTPEVLQEYWEFLLTKVKSRTAARHLSSLRLFFQFAESQGWIHQNPVALLQFPRIDYNPPEMLTPQEVVALLEAPSRGHYLGLRDRAMLELSYSCGLKINELLGLNVDDLYFDLGFIKIRTRRERMVPLTSKATEVLEEYLTFARQQRLLNKEDPCLFPGRNGQRISRVGFWQLVKRHARRAGITTNINPRTLRHSFAMHLLQNGMDLTGIKALFGYVDLNATLQYAHVNVANYSEVYQKYHPRAQKRPHSSADVPS